MARRNRYANADIFGRSHVTDSDGRRWNVVATDGDLLAVEYRNPDDRHAAVCGIAVKDDKGDYIALRPRTFRDSSGVEHTASAHGWTA